MASRTYPREPTIESFGAKLLQSGDLDPLYIALVDAKLSREKLSRFLFAYWCCYHAGASAYLSDLVTDFWGGLAEMASNETPTPFGGRWPRGHERRHFRGKKAVDAVKRYAAEFRAVEDLVKSLVPEDAWTGKAHVPFSELRRRVLQLPQFGPWIAFKVGDMFERVMGVPVDFTDSDVFMFDSPREAALETARLWSENEDLNMLKLQKESTLVQGVSATLIAYFKESYAPPRYDRPVNIQEVETILCKFKSHQNGSYPLGLDSEEIKHGLKAWAPFSSTAARLALATPTYEAI